MSPDSGRGEFPARPALLRAPSLKLWRKRLKLCEGAVRRACGKKQ
jgi:hypothetical protein